MAARRSAATPTPAGEAGADIVVTTLDEVDLSAVADGRLERSVS